MTRILIWCMSWTCSAYLAIALTHFPTAANRGDPILLLLLIWLPATFILWSVTQHFLAYVYPEAGLTDKKKKFSLTLNFHMGTPSSL